MKESVTLGPRSASRPRRPRRRGFTLIELMIVVCIIGILASIMIPSFKHSRAQAQLSACSQNLKSLYTAVQMYAADNSGQYPVGVDGSPTDTYIMFELSPHGHAANAARLLAYCSFKTAPRCPASTTIGYHYAHYRLNDTVRVQHNWNDPAGHVYLLGNYLGYPMYGSAFFAPGSTGLVLKP